MAGFASTSTRQARSDHLDGSDGPAARVLTCGNPLREDRGVFDRDEATLYGSETSPAHPRAADTRRSSDDPVVTALLDGAGSEDVALREGLGQCH